MSESTAPSWMFAEGMDADLTPEVKIGAGSNLRFWLPPGHDRQIVFLTDGNKAKIVWEHQVFLRGNWHNHFSCLQPMGITCPLCRWADRNEGQFQRRKNTFLTVLDTHTFKDRSGKERKNERRLFCAKKDTVEILKRKYNQRLEKGENLRGALFTVFRSASDKSPQVGTEFDFEKMVDLATLGCDTSELDLTELLRPNPELVNRVIEQLSSGTTSTPSPKSSRDSEESLGSSDRVAF